MWVFFILVVLCLGYIESTSTPFGRATLRRSQGWEAYAHLAKNGLGLLSKGVLLAVVFFVFALLLTAIWSFFSWLLFDQKASYNTLLNFLSYDVFRGVRVYEVLVVLLAYGYQVGNQKQNEDDWQEEFRSQNAVLNMIAGATEHQTPLRVSLKSRKVYIGIVEGEQFVKSDLENITLIPYLSGHRDKDTLQMVLDHSYSDVYKKNKINDDKTSLTRFRVVIRMDEVESMSLFDIAYYNDFQNKET